MFCCIIYRFFLTLSSLSFDRFDLLIMVRDDDLVNGFFKNVVNKNAILSIISLFFLLKESCTALSIFFLVKKILLKIITVIV